MILWFLRMFTTFTDMEAMVDLTSRNYEKQSGVYGDKVRIEHERDSLKSDLVFVRAAHDELKTENLRLQDRVEAMTEDRRQLWDLVNASLSGERASYQMQINEAWQKSYGVVPYSDAAQIPPNRGATEGNVGPVPGGRRMLPSEIIAKKTQDFWAAKKAIANPVPRNIAVPVG